jgi:phospholipid/cholesterol/gamma-HCH transport system substrate-binding protein
MKTKTSYTSDYAIAFIVILCTLALLAGLAAALTSGFQLRGGGRTLYVDFPDVAGIHRHSTVRYAGAPAGTVVGMRHLSAEERLTSADLRNAVRVTLSLRDEVPPIPNDVIAALGADTLLSEKFIGISAGTAGGPLLADGAVIQGLAQPTIDDLIRNASDLIAVMNKTLPGVEQQMADLLPKIAAIADAGNSIAKEIQPLLTKADTLINSLTALSGSGQDIAVDTKTLIGRANQLITSNEANLEKTLTELPQVLDHLDTLLQSTQDLVGASEKEGNKTLGDLRALMQDMRIVMAHAKSFTAALAGGRPTRLIWTKDGE